MALNSSNSSNLKQLALKGLSNNISFTILHVNKVGAYMHVTHAEQLGLITQSINQSVNQ